MKAIAYIYIIVMLMLLAGIFHEATELEKHFPTETQFGQKYR